MRLGMVLSGGAVNFPGIDISLKHLAEGIEIFGIRISFSGMLIALALFLGLFIAERLAKKTEQNAENYLDMAAGIVVGGVIGARITYIIMHWSYYKEQPNEMFVLNQGGMSFLGALLTGLLISFVYCKKRKISWLKTCDTAIIGVIAAQIIGRIGDFFSRNTLGTYSDGPLAMQVALEDVETKAMTLSRASSKMIVGDFMQVHPVFLYEILLLLPLSIVLFLLYKKKQRSGLVLALYLIGYGSIRFATEFIRLDSVKISGSAFSLEHLISLFVILFGVWILTNDFKKQYAKKRKLPKNFLKQKKDA